VPEKRGVGLFVHLEYTAAVAGTLRSNRRWRRSPGRRYPPPSLSGERMCMIWLEDQFAVDKS